jgi:hypothetical protein
MPHFTLQKRDDKCTPSYPVSAKSILTLLPVLIEVFNAFPEFPQGNSETVPQIDHVCLHCAFPECLQVKASYGLHDRMIGVRFPVEAGNFLFDNVSRPVLGPSSLLSNEYRRLFPWEQIDRGVKLTTHFHLVSRLKNAWRYTFTPPKRLHGVMLG